MPRATTKSDDAMTFYDISIFVGWEPDPGETASRSEWLSQWMHRYTELAAFLSDPQRFAPPSSILTNEAPSTQLTPVPSVRYLPDERPLILPLWRGLHLYASPVDDAAIGIAELGSIIATLLAAGRAVSESLAGTSVGVFFMLHIGRVVCPRRERKMLRLNSLANEALDDVSLAQLFDSVDAGRHAVGMGTMISAQGPVSSSTPTSLGAGTPSEASPPRPPVLYRHFDPQRSRHGNLVLDPRLALALDISEGEARTFFDMAQQTHITDLGLDPNDYAALEMRVSIWNSARETQATEQHVATLNDATNIATRGQVMLSLALFGIGTFIAVLTTDTLPVRHLDFVVGTVFCVLAAVCYIGYIFAGRQWLNILGLANLLLAVGTGAGGITLLIALASDYVLPYLRHIGALSHCLSLLSC